MLPGGGELRACRGAPGCLRGSLQDSCVLLRRGVCACLLRVGRRGVFFFQCGILHVAFT